MKELDQLIKLIQNIQIVYDDISNEWDNVSHKNYNQSKILVKDAQEDQSFILDVLNYQNFLNTNVNEKILKLSMCKDIDHLRIKHTNSIFYKLDRYLNKEIKGKKGSIPIKKCFNDLLGIRMILNDKYALNGIVKLIRSNYLDLKCIDSSNGDYTAVHVYFAKDNFHYQWELQIWLNADEKTNLISHKNYKQEYTKWEDKVKKLKGGVEW